jgi:hypothetical protein
MRAFGCPYFVHVPRANHPKTAPSAREGNFVCCIPSFRAWLVWMLDTRAFLSSRNVTFHEADHLGRFDPELPNELHSST